MRRNFLPDQELTDQLFTGSTDAFEELYHRHWYSLYSYCFVKLKSPDDAKIIVKNIFISLWEKRNELPVTFSISSYLYSEVRNEVIKCITAKMQNQAEETFIEEQIIPGFASQELEKAAKPVSYKRIYSALADTAEKIHPKETVWTHYFSRQSFKGLKHTLHSMLNF